MRYTLLLLALAGCATEIPNDWRREGSTPDDLYRDRGQCRAQAISAPYGLNQDAVTAIYRACMEGKGWHDVAH